MPGALFKALNPVSAYAAKKTTLWADVNDRINGAIIPRDLDALEAWLDARELDVPSGWRDEFQELIDAKRAELRAEDIGQILQDRFDFL
jgi:hypothetical protein